MGVRYDVECAGLEYRRPPLKCDLGTCWWSYDCQEIRRNLMEAMMNLRVSIAASVGAPSTRDAH